MKVKEIMTKEIVSIKPEDNVKEALKLNPLIFGGSQEKTLRPGTENIYGIVSLGEATEKAFKSGELNTIITTDMILQLLELTNIETIINYDLPTQHEEYFSRLMLVDTRGESISFVSPEEKGLLSVIEMRMKMEIPQEEVKEFVPTLPAVADEAANSSKEKKKKPRHRTQVVKKVKKKKKEE